MDFHPELIDSLQRTGSGTGKERPGKGKSIFQGDSIPMPKYNDFFGPFGGRYVPEVLQPPLAELEKAFREAIEDPAFLKEYEEFCRDYIGRPTPLLPAKNASRELGGANIYIKLEGLANTGAHKINNAAGQALLAKRMGKTRIIAETGAGQHGVATAAACARLGLPCVIYMGEEDIRRQHPNVYWMEMYAPRSGR